MKHLENEEWRDVKGFEGYYQISNYGRVKSLERIIGRSNGNKQTIRARILKPCISNSGYYEVPLYKDGKGKQYTVHRLVAEAFLRNVNLCVNHIDGNKLNNCVENLEWCTYSDNITHAIKYGLVKHEPKYGKDNPNAKRIVQIHDGMIVKVWDSMADAQRAGFNFKSISNCCRGECKTHKGYEWQYYEEFNNGKSRQQKILLAKA